ncbi:unnamed protein product [Symbiodinium sp. KB8]|nr:unnamed protein product [Symbiodinium sp. KB8]
MVLLLSRLPFNKLMLLGVRQAARPVAKLAMAGAERSPVFQDCCVYASRLLQTERLNLPRDQAVQAGCTMLGEAVVFGVSGVVLIYEYHRTREAERHRQEAAREEVRREGAASRAELRARIEELREELGRHRSELGILRAEVARTKLNPLRQAGSSQRPWKSGVALPAKEQS